MRTLALLLGVAAALVAAGCDGDGFSFGGSSVLSGDSSRSAEGDFTILLRAFAGPNHVENANYYLKETCRRTDWRGLEVVHKEGRSELLWGRYGTIEDAQANLRRAKTWRPREDAICVYGRALVVPLPGSDPGPAEWDLVNAGGVYTVAVAKFVNLPAQGMAPAVTTRKQDAVDYCRRLRNAGVEAYYHHGPGHSLVTIGTFGEKAVDSVPANIEQVGGTERVTFAEKIRDTRMRRILREYPKLAVNGREEIRKVRDPVTGQVTRQVTPSYPFRIPEQEEVSGAGGLDRIGDTEPR